METEGDIGEGVIGDVDGGLGTGVEPNEGRGELLSAIGRESRPGVPAASFIFSLLISSCKVWHSCSFCENADHCLGESDILNRYTPLKFFSLTHLRSSTSNLLLTTSPFSRSFLDRENWRIFSFKYFAPDRATYFSIETETFSTRSRVDERRITDLCH